MEILPHPKKDVIPELERDEKKLAKQRSIDEEANRAHSYLNLRLSASQKVVEVGQVGSDKYM